MQLSFSSTAHRAPCAALKQHLPLHLPVHQSHTTSNHSLAPKRRPNCSAFRPHRTHRCLRATAMANAGQQPQRVLMVCLGNICRSPTAEAVLQSLVETKGLTGSIEVDSCGTGGGNPDWYTEGGWSYHEGDRSDSRMMDHASRRGIKLTSRSRPLKPEDLHKFDVIVGMDDKNIRAVREAAEYWKGKHDVPADYQKKLVRMCDYLRAEQFAGKYDSVPDPYYGGAKGFELVLDLLEDACEGLLQDMTAKGKAPTKA